MWIGNGWCENSDDKLYRTIDAPRQQRGVLQYRTPAAWYSVSWKSVDKYKHFQRGPAHTYIINRFSYVDKKWSISANQSLVKTLYFEGYVGNVKLKVRISVLCYNVLYSYICSRKFRKNIQEYMVKVSNCGVLFSTFLLSWLPSSLNAKMETTLREIISAIGSSTFHQTT
jgi:hypothetical protein